MSSSNPSLSNPNFLHDQRVVYRALTRMTDDFALSMCAFQFWLKNHASKALNANEFTADLQQYLGISNDQKRTLTVAIHASLNRSVEQMSPVPSAFFSSESSESQSVSPPMRDATPSDSGESKGFVSINSAHHSITTQFLKTIISEVRKLGQESTIELQEVLIEDGLDISNPRLAKLIIDWAKANFSNLELPKDIDISECTQSAHAVYLSVCEAVGPVKADVILNKTITLLNELPEASIFTPNKLL